MYIFQLYHQISKQKALSAKRERPAVVIPDEWKTTYIKFYERFPLIAFPAATNNDKAPLFSTILNRRSGRVFGNTLDKQLLSNLFYFSIGETDNKKGDGIGRRVYPSAGTRYPLEFYVVVFKDIENITQGIYHYDIQAHGLRKIREYVFDSAYVAQKLGYSFVEHATFGVIFTACFTRSSQKYGEKAYKYILLEAGAAMQNFSLVSESLSINSVSLGSLGEDFFEPLLDIDGSEESMVHLMFFG